MNKNTDCKIAIASVEEDLIVARHFYQLWLDNNISPDDIDDNWLQITLEFMSEARQRLLFRSFVATINNEIVASVSCQLFAGLYPSPFKPSFRKYGYIWNIYVESDYRYRGIGSKLTNKAIDYLRTLDCTHAILHASPQGKPVYEKLGFVAKNEMILEL